MGLVSRSNQCSASGPNCSAYRAVLNKTLAVGYRSDINLQLLTRLYSIYNRKRPVAQSHQPVHAYRTVSINSRLLLELNRSACFLKLLLGFFSVVFASCFLDNGRSAVDHFLGFFQTQASQFTNGLDYVYFLLTRTGKYNVKLGLLFSSGFATTSSCRRSSNGCSGRNTEFFFHCFNQRNYVHYAHFSDCVQNVFVRQSHDFLPKYKKWCSTESSS